MAEQNVYSYQVMINGKLMKDVIDADNPQEALYKAVESFNMEITCVMQGDINHYNAATNLVRKNGKAVTKKSQSFYNIIIKAKEPDNSVIYVKKIAGKKKDAFRCIDDKSIPEFLRESVKINGGTVLLRCIENQGDAGVTTISAAQVDLSLKPVIAYEKIDPNRIKDVANKLKPNSKGEYWNVWWKKNADTTLIEKNGVFYEKADGQVKVLQAQLVTTEFPIFLGEAAKSRLKQVKNGWEYTVSWSDKPNFGENNEGYWVKYGEGDFNYLKIGTQSADDYLVCDAQGNTICTLNEQFNKKNKKQTSNPQNKITSEIFQQLKQIAEQKGFKVSPSTGYTSQIRTRDDKVKQLFNKPRIDVINYHTWDGYMIFEDLEYISFEPRNVANPNGDEITQSNIKKFKNVEELLNFVKNSL